MWYFINFKGGRFFRSPMRTLKIIQVALAVVFMNKFIQQTIRRKSIFARDEYYNHLDCKSEAENPNSHNWCMRDMLDLMNDVEKANTDIRDQKSSISTYVNCLFYPPLTCDMFYTEQIALASITQSNLTNLSLTFHISSQSQHKTIFEHVYYEFFSCFMHFMHSMHSIFDFLLNYINIYCSTNLITLLFVIIIIIFVLLFKEANFHSTKSFPHDICINSKHNKDFILFFLILFFTHTFQSFNYATGTLTISSSSDFTDAYKSSTKQVIIENGVSEIPMQAFYQWPLLISAEISNSVTSIGYSAFYSCTSLQSIAIPNSVTTIGDSAFRSCSVLSTVTIGEGLQTIGNSVFYNCSSLKSITIPSSVTTFDEWAFSRSGLTTATIREGLQTIGNSVFYNCSSLKSITIPSSVTSFGEWAFSRSGLETATIWEGLQTIGNSVFYSCLSLISIILP